MTLFFGCLLAHSLILLHFLFLFFSLSMSFYFCYQLTATFCSGVCLRVTLFLFRGRFESFLFARTFCLFDDDELDMLLIRLLIRLLIIKRAMS